MRILCIFDFNRHNYVAQINNFSSVLLKYLNRSLNPCSYSKLSLLSLSFSDNVSYDVIHIDSNIQQLHECTLPATLESTKWRLVYSVCFSFVHIDGVRAAFWKVFVIRWFSSEHAVKFSVWWENGFVIPCEVSWLPYCRPYVYLF